MEYPDTTIVEKAEPSEEKRPRPPLLPPCRVCGGKASGFHYGVNTCEACKGFFRRTFTRATEYKCPGNNDCLIQSRRRNNCPACRLRKCQEIGMSKNAIKTGRYSYEKKTQYIEEVRLRETHILEPHVNSCIDNEMEGSFEDNTNVSSLDGELDIAGRTYLQDCGVRHRDIDLDIKTSYEWHRIYSCQSSDGNDSVCMGKDNSISCQDLDMVDSKYLYQPFEDDFSVSDEDNQKVINDLLKSQDQLIEDLDAFLDEVHMKKRQKEFHRRIQQESPKCMVKSSIPKSELQIKRDEQMDKVAELMDSEFRNTVSFIKAIPGWKKLDMEDQINLIKEGAAELWILGHCQCIDTELGVFTGEYDMTYQDAANIWSDIYVESVYKTSIKFSKLKLTKEELVVLKTIVLTFPDTVGFMSHDSSIEAELIHSCVWLRDSIHTTKYYDKMNELYEEKSNIVRLRSVCIQTRLPDQNPHHRCPMVDRESVETVQWRMMMCLRYICKKNGIPFNRRFAEIMNGLTFARDMTEKFKEIVKTVVCQWVIFEKFPLLKEFFNSF